MLYLVLRRRLGLDGAMAGAVINADLVEEETREAVAAVPL